MANSKQIKILKEKFKEQLEENKKLFEFKIEPSHKIPFQTKEKTDLSKLIKCSENYFEDLIKIYSNNEEIIKLKDDININIKGSGILYLIIEESMTLNLLYNDDNLSSPFVRILVKKGKNLTLIETSNSKTLWKNIVIHQEDKSIVNHRQITINSIWNASESLLEEDSKYDLRTAFYANNTSYHIENTSHHISSNSQSEMNIKGAAANNSKVSVNGLVDIENSAPKSSGHQNIHALILDETSNVSADPILEIKNNQVSCSHGCSITQVKDEIKFYMNSRGLKENQIVNLIVNSFFDYVFEGIQSSNIPEKYLNQTN